MKGKKRGKEIGFLVGFFLKLEKERRVLNFWFALLCMNCFRVTVVLVFFFFFKKRTKILFVCFLHVFFFSNHSLLSGYIYIYFHFYIK